MGTVVVQSMVVSFQEKVGMSHAFKGKISNRRTQVWKRCSFWKYPRLHLPEHTKLRARVKSKATVADSDFEEDKAFHG
jgi:hypothetical protein